MTELDNEAWVRILEEKNLSSKDLVKFSLTNRRFNGIAMTNGLWKRKFVNRYPDLQLTINGTPSWYRIFQTMVFTGRHLNDLLDQLSHKFILYSNSQVSYSEIEQHLIEWPDYDEAMVLYNLRVIVNHPDRNTNLTRRYYARQIIGYLVRYRILHPRIVSWRSQAQPCLLEGVDIFAQWFLPEKQSRPELIINFVDSSAKRIAARLNSNPNFAKMPLDWDNLLPYDRLRIVEAILFDFQSEEFMADADYDMAIQRSIVELVVQRKRGLPITFCILFYMVARKLGLEMLLISYPGRFLLKFLHHPECDMESQQYSYVDVWAMNILRESELGQLGFAAYNRANLEPVGAFEVVNRMLNNHREHGSANYLAMLAFEMAHLLNPSDVHLRMGLARIYAEYLQFNLDRAYDLLNTDRRPVTNSGCPFLGQHERYKREVHRHLQTHGMNGPSVEARPKLRSAYPGVQHRVGQVMHHRRYNYTCVIVDWDPQCNASAEWQNQMGVHNLPLGAGQPFYPVLVNDGSNRYAAQENLIPEENMRPVEHQDLGRYFERFDRDNGTYVMNDAKRQQYPEDQR